MGVTVLSLIAFAVSPVFVVCQGFFFYKLFIESITPSFTDDTAAFSWLGLRLTVA